MNAEVRNRKTAHIQDTVKSGMNRLEGVMGDSVLKFRMLPSRAKVLVFASGVLSLFFYIYIGKWLFQGDPETVLETLLETEKCPACYGGSACGMIYYKHVELAGMSKYRTLDIINERNVHYGSMRPDGKQVVLKKLATDTQIKEMDKRLCLDAKRPEDCDIARVIVRTDMGHHLRQEPVTPDFLKKTEAFMFYCPSYRLVDRMWTYFQEYKKKDEIFMSDKMQVMYTSLVNPEPLMLQTFPKKEGWPFPEYMGSCGRVVVEEFAGEPLSSFVGSSFAVRAGIAYELLRIAEKLTTKSDFALYLTDVDKDNFAVDKGGKVTVIDLEHIIVVDTVAIQARKPKDWNEPHEAIFHDCEGTNCLVFNTDELCKRVKSDHNYNAICRNILSKHASESGMPEGFLHSMPEEAKDYWDLENLLEECVRPTQKQGRWMAKDKLIKALKALRDESKEHSRIVGERQKAGRQGDKR